MAEQFYGTPTGPTQRGYDYVYDGRGPLQLAERLAARNTQKNLAQERLNLRASAARAKADQADGATFDKIKGYDAGDYGSLLYDDYNNVVNTHRDLYKKGQFDPAYLRSDLTPLQNRATILKNLSEQKRSLAAGLNTENFIDPGTYAIEFDKAVKTANANGEQIDANAIHERVLQNADLVYGNKIADSLIKDANANMRKEKIAFDSIDPSTGLKRTDIKEIAIPTYAKLNDKKTKVIGYDTPAILETYLANPAGRKRFELMLQKESADPQSRYNTEQARINQLNDQGKLRGEEYDRLTKENQYKVIAKDFGELEKRFGSDFASIVDKEALSADQKEELSTRGYTEGVAGIYTAGGKQAITVPELNFQMSPKQKITESINTSLAFKEGAKGSLTKTDDKDNLNEGLASQNFSVTTIPTFKGVKDKQLYSKDGKPIKKGTMSAIEEVDFASTLGGGNVYFKREDGKMVYMPKEDFLKSSYVEFPLYAKVQLFGKAVTPYGLTLDPIQESRSKGTYYLPMNQNKNAQFLNMAIEKGNFRDVGELRQKISEMARQGLLGQKGITKKDDGSF